MKKLLSFGAALAVSALALAGCSSGGNTDSGNSSPEGSQSDDAGTSSDASYTVGIIKQMEHPSLTAASDGFKAALEESGLNVKFDDKDANGDKSVAASIAGTFKEQNVDLVLAIGTDSAQAAANAMDETPILFTAVTDPVDAQLVASWEEPGANVTGTSDANPVADQIELITEIVPGAKTVGVVYSPGEPNSVVQVEWVKEAAEKLGIEVVESPSTESSMVKQAAQTLADKGVDAIYVPTDNTVVTSLESVLMVGEDNKIPVFGAEGDSVERGCVATYGLDYYQLGYETGLMAVQILKGEKQPGEIAVATLAEPQLYLNLAGAERMGVTISESLLEQAAPENIFE
ncbi:ABC transporter substrate-binding protein [Actinomycetaceae bacterium MB13-C1-2]|nr:ABC transporter substrate-binding protein [Actinomycetaceae bacterium MB13-C1-2]